MKKTIQLTGLDCANCALELERELAALDGVRTATITFVNQKLFIEYDNQQALQKAIDVANAFEEVKVVEKTAEIGGRYALNVKEWLPIALSTLFLVAVFSLEHFQNNNALRVLYYACFAVAYLTAGYSVLYSTVKSVAKGKLFDENFLMSIASIGAIFIGEFTEAVAVMLLYQIGETLQAMAVNSSRRSIADLMALKSDVVTLLEDNGTQKQVTPEEISVGDRVLVKPGDKIPVDGALLGDVALLDTKSLTGEPKLKVVKRGEELLSGCLNAGAAFEMSVLRPYEDSTVCKILDIVENAAAAKAAPERFITKFARVYTPIVCVFALLLAVGAPLIEGVFTLGGWHFANYRRWLQSALTFLVISCPCALVISVPLTYFSGIGKCAKQGVLVKGATNLETLSKASIVAFDKTGTLTEGVFKIRNVTVFSVTKEEILAITAALERHSSHPIAKAFSGYTSEMNAAKVEEIAGKGLRGEIDGKVYFVGTHGWLDENEISCAKLQSDDTTVYVGVDGGCVGVIEIGDKIRAEAKECIRALETLNFNKIAMLTGDNEQRAKSVANTLNIRDVYAKLLPQNKLETAKKLKEEGTLVYLGDGINDAPVMVEADCAVSMGKLGSAAAVEASDFVLITENLLALPKCVTIARKTRRIVRQNIVFSIVMKVVFMVLGVIGILPLWLAVFADVGVMLLAVFNALRK